MTRIILALLVLTRVASAQVSPVLVTDQTLTGKFSISSPGSVRVKTGGGLSTGGGVGGLTLEIDCGTGQGLRWSGTAWACGDVASLVAGTTNTLAKFTPDGSHVGNSLELDDGTTFSIGAQWTTTIATSETTLHARLHDLVSNSSGIETVATSTNDTANRSGINARTSGTFDTTGGVITASGIDAVANATRSGGANNLINAAVVANASGAQINRSFWGVTGTFLQNDAGAFGSTLDITGAATADAGKRIFDNAGTGLTSSANTVSLNINGGSTQTCGAGSAVTSVTGAGIASCTAFGSGSGSVTSVATGAGLTGGTITTTGTLSLNINAGVTQTCSAGNAVTAVTATGITTCAAFGSGSGTVTGTGTSGTISKWTSSTAIGNSLLTDSGSALTYTVAGSAGLHLVDSADTAELDVGVVNFGPFARAVINDTHGVGINIQTNSTNAILISGSQFVEVVGGATFDSTVEFGGAATFDSTIDMTSHKIVNVTDPTNPQEAATKHYVDGVALSAGALSGSGTTNTTVKWGGSSALTNGWALDNGTTWGVGGKFTIDEATGNTQVSGTLGATGVATLSSALMLGGVSSPTAITGTNNNVAISGSATVVRQALSANATITGLVAPAANQLVVLENIDSSHTLKITHEDSNSTAANRFTLPFGNTIVIPAAGSVTLRYDTTSARWHVEGASIGSYAPSGMNANTVLVTNATNDGITNSAITDNLSTTVTISEELTVTGTATSVKQLSASQNFYDSGTAFTLSSGATCGTSPTIATNAGSSHGSFTAGSSPSGTCVATFGTAFVTNAPSCVVTTRGSTKTFTVTAISTSGISMTGLTAAQIYDFSCSDH